MNSLETPAHSLIWVVLQHSHFSSSFICWAKPPCQEPPYFKVGSGSTSKLQTEILPTQNNHKLYYRLHFPPHSSLTQLPFILLKNILRQSSRKGTSLSEHTAQNSSLSFSQNKDNTGTVKQCIKRCLCREMGLPYQKEFAIQHKKCFSCISNRNCTPSSTGSCLTLQHARDYLRSSSDSYAR